MRVDRRHALGLLGGAAFFAPGRAPAATPEPPALGLSGQIFPVPAAGVYGSVSAFPDGRFLVNWQADGVLFGRYFKPDGSPDGGQRKFLTEGLADACSEPVTFGDGTALVAWPGALFGDPGNPAVFVRTLKSSGATSGKPVRISGDDSPSQCLAARLEAKAAIVAWRTLAPEQPGSDVRWRIVGANGKPQSPIRTLARKPGDKGFSPLGVRGLTDGGAVLAYYRHGAQTTSGPAFAQRLDKDGKPVGGPIELGADDIGALGLTALDKGAFCVAWESLEPRGAFDRQLAARVVSAKGEKGPIRKNPIALDEIVGYTRFLTGIKLATTKDGRIVALAGGATFDGRIVAQTVTALLMNAKGVALAGPLKVVAFNSVSGFAEPRGLAARDDGTFVAYWIGASDGARSFGCRLKV